MLPQPEATLHPISAETEPVPDAVDAPGALTDVLAFEAICRRKMPPDLWRYTAGSTGSGWTLRRNRLAFEWVDVDGGTPVDPTGVDPSVELLGISLPYPIVVAPTAYQRDLHPGGEAETYRGASRAATLTVLPNASTIPHEEAARAATGPLWMQLYPFTDFEKNRRRLELYQDSGARAVIITIDQQATEFPRIPPDSEPATTPPPDGLGRNLRRASASAASGAARYGLAVPGKMWYTWDLIDRLHDLIRVPTLIKGVMTPEDALACVERGYDGIIVSNHGGRSLDYSPSTLEVLPDIVRAVGNRVPVLIDSGFRRGEDVLKALALGATAVGVGRPVRWGLGAFGSEGVERVLEILQTELRNAMSSRGMRSISEIRIGKVRTRFP